MVKQWRDGGQIGITGKTRVKIRVLNWTNVVAASEYKFIDRQAKIKKYKEKKLWDW